jgi:predicted dehydrogenase
VPNQRLAIITRSTLGEASMGRIRIAVVGAGLMGKRHISLVQSNGRCALSGIVDPCAAASDIARSAGVPRFRSIEELLATGRPDAVILATPNRLHVEQAICCIHERLPALVEKPVAHNVTEGTRLLAAERAGDTPILVGHHRAHSAILSRARDIIQSGRLGKIVGIMGTAVFYKPADYFEAGSWRRELGGGPILINLIHEIGVLRFLCGEIVAVQAFASNVTRSFPVEDTVAVNLRFSSGALGSFMLSDTAACPLSWEQTSGENQIYANNAADCYVISGDLGSLFIPTMRILSYPSRPGRSWLQPFAQSVELVPQTDPLVRQLDHFCDVVTGDSPPLVTVFDGLRNLTIIEAIARASPSGEIIETLPPDTNASAR